MWFWFCVTPEESHITPGGNLPQFGNHWVRMLIKQNFFQHQLCLFSPGDGHLQKGGFM